MRQFFFLLLALAGGTITSLGGTSENAAIVLQGDGNCTTRSFRLQDNWHIEFNCLLSSKIQAVPEEMSPPTVLYELPQNATPAPNTALSKSSPPVAKGGTYSFEITSTGTWQVTIYESGFSKDLLVNNIPVTSPASPAQPSAALPGMPPQQSLTPPAPQNRLISSFNGSGNQDKSQEFVVNNNWIAEWTVYGSKYKITLVPTDGSESTVLVDKLAGDATAGTTNSIVSTTPDAPTTPSTPQTTPPYPYQPNQHTPYQPYGMPPTGGMTPTGMISRSGRDSSFQSIGGSFTLKIESKGPWMIRIYQANSDNVQMASMATASGTLGVSSAPTPPAPTVKLTDDQACAVVLITGDHGEGTGFLVKMPDGPAVVTNIHVISNNPNLKVKNNSGALIPVLSAKGAADRDLAILSIKDAGYSYLDVCPDISKGVQTGDEVITPGNSEGGEVMLNTGGKVLGMGPQRIEIDNPIYHGNSGGPIFQTKSNQVVGVVTEAMKVNITNSLDRASFANRNSAIANSMRYFGMRLDNVPNWVPIDWDRLQTEGAFLDQFHELSRCLDSYLNTPNTVYKNEEKIVKANDNFNRDLSGSDSSQRIQALKGLLFELQGIADKNLAQIQNAGFYSFNQIRAQEEIDYRKALKTELDKIGNDVGRLNGMVRVSN